ncbi:hypothetical protein RHMOL_Rhmol05G0016000 [Rhododendron molle]|uniref:Uncharacterized protein n=1 Tax=Rhododendron molle TaxID=49168 RepID=A0ACC0NK79_RHOML|nr:hypothetical protein RHMOL_Rhmol05G0016000 [Rhododendron molle]
MTTVTVAVNGGGGNLGGNGSRRAVRWAVENLIPSATRFVLVDVVPPITSIPTPSGDTIPIEQLDAHVIETLVLEGDNLASALLKYVIDSGVSSLVLGSCSSSFITRKLKDSTVPSPVLKNAPEACNVYIVSRHKLLTTSATPLSTGETKQSDVQAEVDQLCLELNGCRSSSSEYCEDNDTASSVSDVSFLNSIAIAQERYPNSSGSLRERNHRNSGTTLLEVESVNECHSVASTETKKSDVQAEEEQLRIELMNTVGMCNRAFEDLVQAQNEVHFLSSKCLEEERQVNTALQREEVYKKILAEVKRKHLEAVEEIEIARNLLAKETYERQIAESNALKKSVEKKKIIDALLSNDRRYRRYTRDEIEIATNSFSETKMIGEGSYGKVYRCDLDKTPVAVKVLRSDALEKEQEFLTGVFSSLDFFLLYSFKSPCLLEAFLFY